MPAMLYGLFMDCLWVDLRLGEMRRVACRILASTVCAT